MASERAICDICRRSERGPRAGMVSGLRRILESFDSWTQARLAAVKNNRYLRFARRSEGLVRRAPAGQQQQRRTLDSRDTYLLTKFLGKKHHTNTIQLAELASKAKLRLLIIYHGSIVLRPALRSQASSPKSS